MEGQCGCAAIWWPLVQLLVGSLEASYQWRGLSLVCAWLHCTACTVGHGNISSALYVQKNKLHFPGDITKCLVRVQPVHSIDWSVYSQCIL